MEQMSEVFLKSHRKATKIKGVAFCEECLRRLGFFSVERSRMGTLDGTCKIMKGVADVPSFSYTKLTSSEAGRSRTNKRGFLFMKWLEVSCQ